MKIGILTGGGDCPGLNAVIYGALLRASKEEKATVIGIKKGWQVFTMKKEEITPEIVAKYTQELDIGEFDDLQREGGTILYTSRSNPFKAAAKLRDPAAKEAKSKEIGTDLAEKFKILGIDALLAIGGEIGRASCRERV